MTEFESQGADLQLATVDKVLSDIVSATAGISVDAADTVHEAVATIRKAAGQVRHAYGQVADWMANETMPHDARINMVERLATDIDGTVDAAHRVLDAQVDIAEKVLTYEALPPAPSSTHDRHRVGQELATVLQLMSGERLEAYLEELATRDDDWSGVLFTTFGRDLVRAKLGDRGDSVYAKLVALAVDHAKRVGGERAAAARAREALPKLRGIMAGVKMAAKSLAEDGRKAARDAEEAYAKRLQRTAYLAGQRETERQYRNR